MTDQLEFHWYSAFPSLRENLTRSHVKLGHIYSVHDASDNTTWQHSVAPYAFILVAEGCGLGRTELSHVSH